MNINIVYGSGGAPLYRISANPGEPWMLKISRSSNPAEAFTSFSGSGERQDVFPSDPGTYYFFLYIGLLGSPMRISYTILPPAPVLPPKPSEPLPAQTGYYPAGDIGTCCEIQQFNAFNQLMFRYRNKYTNWSGGNSPSMSTTRSAANSDPQCFAPAPPTATTWQDGISQQIKSSFNVLGTFLNTSVNSIITPINSEMANLESRILESVRAQIAAINIDTTKLENTILSKLGASIAAISAGLAALESRILSRLAVEILAVNKTITAMDTKFSTYIINDFKTLGTAISSLETRILAKILADIKTVNTALTALETKILANVTAQITAVNKALTALETKILANVTAQITALNTTISGLEAKILTNISNNILELLLKKLMEGR